MNNDEETLDLLDLDDDTGDVLPDVAPLSAPRPKKPWLLLGVAVAIIVLATYVIVKTVGGNSSSSVDIDLDAPALVVDGAIADLKPAPVATPVVQPLPQPAVKPATVPETKPVVQENASVHVRQVQDRKDVTFNPAQTVDTKQPVKKAPVSKPVSKAPAGAWYVQLGSYSSRALAENGERKLRAAHPALFSGMQTTILAAVLKNGTTTYRLRVSFNNQNDANGFCRNAKSDGLDCYVAK